MQNKIHVWTEAFNCAELLNPLLKSYCENEQLPIHAYIFDFEFYKVEYFNDKIHYVLLPTKIPLTFNLSLIKNVLIGKWIKSGYRSGHLGTARFWTYLIKSRREKLFIHLDSDILFLKPILQQIVDELEAGAICSGRRRMYRFNLNMNIDSKITSKIDCIDTVLFGFKPKLLRYVPALFLTSLIRGQGFLNRLFLVRTLDFFDKATLLLSKFGRISYLDSPEEGRHGLVNLDSKFNNSFIEVYFGVGSGCAIWNQLVKTRNLSTDPLSNYQTYALANWAFYSKYILGQDLGLSLPKDSTLLDKVIRFNFLNYWEPGH
jgi:hypothetical protein